MVLSEGMRLDCMISLLHLYCIHGPWEKGGVTPRFDTYTWKNRMYPSWWPRDVSKGSNRYFIAFGHP